MSNSEYAVGTVCVIVAAHPMYAHMIGRECTVVKGLHDPFGCNLLQYEIDIEGEDKPWYAGHHHIKPKQQPKDEQSDEAFRSFMDKLLFPIAVTEEA